MRRIVVAIVFLFVGTACIGQSAPQTGVESTINKFKLFYNNNQPDSLFYMFQADSNGSLKKRQIRNLFEQLQQLGKIQKVSYINAADNVYNYKSYFDKSILRITLSLDSLDRIRNIFFGKYVPAHKATDAPLIESPIKLKVKTGFISGILTVPKSVEGRVPVVLIIAGSGPTDLDGNTLSANVMPYSYWLLANELNNAGIATLRYDKRGVGRSTPISNENNLRFEDYVDDAIALINMLKEDGRFSKSIVLGHSEGSLIGIISAKNSKADAFISVSGAGESADKILLKQLNNNSSTFSDSIRLIINTLKQGYTVKNINPLFSIVRPSVQPYLISWFKYDPKKEISNLRIPVLIIQGNSDLQVGEINAHALKTASPSATIAIINKMNHVLKYAPLDRKANFATYNNPDDPLHPQLMIPIVKFIKGLN